MKSFLLSKKFRKLSASERLAELSALLHGGLSSQNRDIPHDFSQVEDSFKENTWFTNIADIMIESAIGMLSIPLGIVSNFMVNGVVHQLALATEESSVIAAANYASKIFSLASVTEGVVKTTISSPLQISQVALGNVNVDGEKRFVDNMNSINNLLMEQLSSMQARGGGLRRIEYKRFSKGLFIVYITIDVQDAMGANIANAAAEFIAPKIQALTDGSLLGAIVSNYSDERVVKAEVDLDISKFPHKEKSPDHIAQNIDYLSKWAELDIYRATTNNKGIMNGVVALALATGNDTRAIEAASHTLAATLGKKKKQSIHFSEASESPSYMPLTTWDYLSHKKILHGEIILPALFATKGGATSQAMHKWCIDLLSLNYEKEITAHILNRVAAGLGLAQNFAALLAISTTGIQEGHMKLHNRKYESSS